MTELPHTFSLPRTTGTFGDVFAAAGLAKLLAFGRRVRILESATGFGVTAEGSGPVTFADSPGYSYLKTNDKTVVPRGASDPVDYKAEKAKSDRVRELRKGKSLKSLDEATLQLIEQSRPRPDFPLLQVLNLMQGDETTNRVQSSILKIKPAEFRGQIRQGLEALAAHRPSNLEWPATSVQLFTPNAAKGYCRVKPDSTDRNDKSKDQWIDPFVEWLRYQGYFAIACPVIRGKDIRLLCPIPHDISIASLSRTADELRRVPLFGSPAKVDSIATLKVAEILLTHSLEYRDASADPYDDLALANKRPSDVISGLAITHYQSLGNARAVSAMSTLALPGWFPLSSPKEAELLSEILAEHQKILRVLNDEHSEEMGLVIAYRRFLQARGEPSLNILLEFMGAYGAMLPGAWQEGRRLPAFRTKLFRRMVMALNHNLASVLDDPGFLAVASAIRRATVSAQAQKAMKRPDYREIRYDLLPELRRKSSLAGPEPLVQAVSDFISKYNTENARRRELNKMAPRNVTTDEFRAFVNVTQKFGAPTIGAMLAAYGSCREPRELEPAEAGADSNDSVQEEK